MVRPIILVVEDEVVVAESLRLALKGLGYEVPPAVHSGEEAVREALETIPDLVLMDITLAGRMDGIEAATLIHQRQELPVVFLTALSDRETLARAGAARPSGYLVKPFTHAELQQTIASALAARVRRRGRRYPCAACRFRTAARHRSGRIGRKSSRGGCSLA